MAGQELATEGFQAGQVGSSAMPHKMNTRSCERINGFEVILRGHLTMVAALAGDQWNEGDVSCSVVRRVALPDAFLATDGLFETFLSVLAEFGAYGQPSSSARLDRYLPFLATTKVLVAAVRAGAGRRPPGPRGHQGARRWRSPWRQQASRGRPATTWWRRLAADPRLGLSDCRRHAGRAAGRPARLRGGGAAPRCGGLLVKRRSELHPMAAHPGGGRPTTRHPIL